MVDLKNSAKYLLSNTLLCNAKLLSRLYAELAKQSMKEYKKSTVKEYTKKE